MGNIQTAPKPVPVPVPVPVQGNVRKPKPSPVRTDSAKISDFDRVLNELMMW